MTEKTIYKVGGAGCSVCILKILNIVKPLANVDDAKFDLKHNTLTVIGKPNQNDVITAMESGKFTAKVMTG